MKAHEAEFVPQVVVPDVIKGHKWAARPHSSPTEIGFRHGSSGARVGMVAVDNLSTALTERNPPVDGVGAA